LTSLLPVIIALFYKIWQANILNLEISVINFATHEDRLNDPAEGAVILAAGYDLHLRMWVPGNLPPNLVFLIVVTARESRPVGDSNSGHPIAADAPDETAHFQDRDRGQHSVDG